MFRIRLFVAVFAFVTAVCCLPGSGFAETATFSASQKSEIEHLVRNYLVKNPEVLVEAMTELRTRQQLAEKDELNKALAKNRSALLNDPKTPVAGNPQGDVSVVEFYDYSCPYCKSVEDNLKALLKADDKVRLVLKEFPVLGTGSTLAAKAALASQAQGKFLEFHEALMTARGQFTEESLMRVAKSVGLDTARLKADMESSSVESALAANMALAEDLNLRGTPAFVIGDRLFPGVIDLKAMKQAVAEARKKK